MSSSNSRTWPADALAGHGLEAVCERELVVAGFDKSAQTSNWGLHPLTVEQVRYAALDAEVLLALYARFAEPVG